MRASIVLAFALATAPAAAQADVTVLFPEPAPRAPLVAVPVRASPETARVEGLPSAEPSSLAAIPPRGSQPAVAAPPAAPAAPAPPVPAVEEVEEVVAPSAAASAPELACPPSPVRFIRTTDGSRETRLLHLTDCRGAPSSEDLLELSILARPRTAERPSARDLAAHEADPELFASEVRRLDPGLLVRLRALADHFPGHDIELTSGYRPDARETSRHRTGHALDLRVVGAPLEEVHAFALSFDDSGVGLYPTSEFLHVDVRPRITRWVDLAGPGEPANMVEVVTGRDGHAASAPPLRWPAAAEPSEVAPAPSRSRRSREGSPQAALGDALQALDGLEGLDLQVP